MIPSFPGNIQPRAHQIEARNALIGYFSRGNIGNPLLVLPTAAGKSVINALLCADILNQWPDQRILCLTHVKELIEQNHERLLQHWPKAPAGVYSASVGRRDTKQSVIFAGIQSVYDKAFQLGPFDLVFIDECHLVPPADNGMYRKMIDELLLMNPHTKFVGLTATHYRMSSGILTEGKGRIFTDVAYEIPIRRLIDEGYLCPLIGKRGAQVADLSGAKVIGGDYRKSDLENAFNRAALTDAATDEIIAYGRERRAWLIFCVSVAHAEEVAAAFNLKGISTEVISGKTPKRQREAIIARYKAGLIRCITNCDVLTTGFDAPAVDLIGFLRATKSAGLYVQMCGRGMRISPSADKQNCLVLDYAGNIQRHGPVDQIKPRKKRGRKTEIIGAPTKVCPECKSVVMATVMECDDCGYLWPQKDPHSATASELDVMATEGKPHWDEVTEVRYSLHQKPRSPTTLKVTYRCGLMMHSEWICFEHQGYPKQKAVKWWMDRTHPGTPVPSMSGEALEYIRAHGIGEPGRIQVRRNGKYHEVIGYGPREKETA